MDFKNVCSTIEQRILPDSLNTGLVKRSDVIATTILSTGIGVENVASVRK
jgi:hypothetical protein